MFPVRIHDSRNAPFHLHEPARKRLVTASADRGGTGLGVIAEATERRVRGGSTGAVSAAIGYSLGVTILALFAASSFLRGSIGFGVLWLVVLAYTLFELFIKRWYRRWRHREQILRALRAIDRCGACGYELRGISPQEDGCAVCPECGAAWRADKVRSAGEPRWSRPAPWHRKYVRDDRGWQCRPFFGVRPSLFGRGMARKEVVLASCGWPGWAAYAMGWLAVFVFVVGIAASIALEVLAIGAWSILASVALLVLGALSWPVAWWVRCERMRLALLGEGMCVCCHDRLPDEPEGDGRCVCGTCGSAWALEWLRRMRGAHSRCNAAEPLQGVRIRASAGQFRLDSTVLGVRLPSWIATTSINLRAHRRRTASG